MARPSNGANFNIAQLEQFLNQRRNELNKLYKQRTDLGKKLDGVEREIARLEGGMAGTGRRGGGRGSRPKNDKPLPDVVEQVMREAGRAMKVPEIAEGALAAGYKSNSANFKGIVNQQLIKDKRFVQAERGVYQLKK